MDPDQIKKIKGLSLLGEVYTHRLQNEFKRFGNIEKDWRVALKFFLKNYAFERQGAPKAYPDSAVKAFDLADKKADRPGKDLAKEVWKKFCQLIPATNPDRNPLSTKEDPQSIDILSFCAQMDKYGYNIFQFALDGIKKDLLQTHNSLVKIRGIGPKIASFFLRDVAFLGNISINELEKLQDRSLLQPVDVWVRRTVSFLDGSSGQKDEEIAKRLVEMAVAAQCCPLSLNAGAWYLGAKIATTDQRLTDCLKDMDELKKNIEKWLSPRQEETKKLSEVFDKIKEI